MPPIAVAIQGDVVATAGTGLPPGADSGTWTAGSVSYQTYPKLKVGGNVAHKASCTFTFAGASSSGSPVSNSSTVTLTAGTTKLQKGANFVLQDGDQQTDSFGNILQAQSSRKLKTD
jgi:hypothetical protein